MLRVSLFVLLLGALMGLPSSASAQQIASGPQYERIDYWCVYVSAYSYITDENGNMVMLHGSCCCKHQDVEVARKCATDQFPPPDWNIDEQNETFPCYDFSCEIAQQRENYSLESAAPSPVVINMKCCGCDGRLFYAQGKGKTWCAALADAKKEAVRAGKRYYGGLRCYFPPKPPACPPNPCATTCPQVEHKGILRRIFCR